MATPEAIAAVTAGIAEASPTPAPAPAPDGETPAPDGETPAPDGEAPAPDDEAPAPDGEAPAPDGAAPAAEAKKTEQKPASDKEAPKEGADKKPEPPKQRDPVNDPIPNALKPDTKARMTALVDIAKKVTGERDRIKADHEEIMGFIRETKATPEQYGQALEYLRLVNSQNPNDSRRALQIMQAEARALALRLGEPVPGVDFLSEHQDLQQAVAEGRISQEHATEIAASRARGAEMQRAGTAGDANAQATAQHEAAVARGRNELNALDAELKAADPHYGAKRAQLIEILKPVFAQIPPAQWAAAFRQAHSKMPNPMAAARPNPAPRVPANTPLRPGNPSGNAASPPSTMLEAVTGALRPQQ